MTTEIAATKDGKVTGLRVHVLADHGAFDACADPSKWPAGFFNIVTGSYDFPVAHVSVDGVYTNKAPGGVAYRCSFRVTEAAYCIERAHGHPGAEARHGSGRVADEELHQARAVPLHSALGWEYDSGDYHTAMNKAMETVGYQKLRAEQKAQARGVQARRDARDHGHRRRPSSPRSSAPARRAIATSSASRCSTPARSACIRPAPASPASAPSRQGQGHETTYAQIIATEIGIPADNIMVEEGNTDTAPYGLGTYGSRSTPVSGAATAMACRKIKAKAQMIAAYMLEVHDDDLEWDVDRFRVKGHPEKFKTMTEIAWAAYQLGAARHGAGARGGELLRSAEHDLSVRRLYLRDGRRRRYRRRPRCGASMRSTIAARASTR